MNPIILYAAKVALCSGLLFGYYLLALRHQPFYKWNRFFLLSSVMLSIAVPLLHIEIGFGNAPATTGVQRIMHIVTTSGESETFSNVHTASTPTATQWTAFGYCAVSTLLLAIIFSSGVRIYRMLRTYPKQKINSIYFLNTDAPGTPFSIFRYIVWNRQLDLHSETGKRIFQHELAHVQQRHTWDKLFLLLVLVPFWCNPFFWLIRRELEALHEFAADEQAVQSHDVSVLAQLILNSAYPTHHFLFTNHFFQSTIKRRIMMFSKLQTAKISYASRILALPFIALLLAVFAFKTKPHHQALPQINQPITVVIDAGHGLPETGAQAAGVYESDLVLSVAQKIKSQNANPNLRILLTRTDANAVDLHQRVQFATEQKADLFLSIHANAVDNQSITATTNTSGMEVLVSSKNTAYQTQSEQLGAALIQSLGSIYATKQNLIKPKTGVWVIDQNICPSVLIECGYLTNNNDRAFMTNEQNQNKIASKILEAIAQYAASKNSNTSLLSDSIPNRRYNGKNVVMVQYFEWPEKRVRLDFADNTEAFISVADAFQANLFDTAERSRIERQPWTIEKVSPEATGDLYVRKASVDEARAFHGIVLLNNKVFNGTFEQLGLAEKDIQFLSIIKGGALNEIAPTATDSVLSVSTKAFVEANKVRDDDPENEPLFTQPEVSARFPKTGGGWMAFLKNLKPEVPVQKGAKPGSYKVTVGFIVDPAGKLYDIKPFTHLGYGMEDEVVRLMNLSPDWLPAQQNGKTVTTYVKQSVTFVIAPTS